MADVATLGIAVDSRQVKAAEQDLSRFEASAKRAGVSVEEMQRRSQATAARLATMRSRTQAASTQLATYSTQASAASVATQRLAVSSGAATAALTRLAGSLVTGFAGAQGYAAIRRAVDEVARIGEVAEKVGVSARELQVFRHAVDMAGGDAAQADRALEGFARKLAEAGNSAGDLYKVFQANGQTISGSISRDFRTFLDLLSRTRNEQDRLAIAQKIFGEDVGRNVVSALAKGSAGLDEYARQAERVGLISDEQIKKAKELDRQFTELERNASTSLKSIAVDVAPALLAVLQAISRVVRDLSYDFALLRQGNFQDVIGLYTSVADRDAAMRRRQFMTGDQSGQMTQQDANAFYGAFGSTFGASGTTGSTGRQTTNPFGTRAATDFDRVTKSITKRIEAMEIEARTFNMTERAAAKYRATQELVNAAHMAGIKITPEMSANIEKLAERYGEVVARLEQLRDRQEAIDFLKDSTKSFLQDFNSGLRDGANAWEAFRNAGANALERISQKLIDMAVNDLFGKAFGGNQGFGFGSLMNAFGGGGGASGGYWQGGTWVPVLHTGGVVGMRGGERRYIHPAYFDDAPRYHNGGIAGLKPNEVPAILERGERVIPNGASVGGISMPITVTADSDPKSITRAIRSFVNSPDFDAKVQSSVTNAQKGRKL